MPELRTMSLKKDLYNYYVAPMKPDMTECVPFDLQFVYLNISRPKIYCVGIHNHWREENFIAHELKIIPKIRKIMGL